MSLSAEDVGRLVRSIWHRRLVAFYVLFDDGENPTTTSSLLGDGEGTSYGSGNGRRAATHHEEFPEVAHAALARRVDALMGRFGADYRGLWLYLGESIGVRLPPLLPPAVPKGSGGEPTTAASAAASLALDAAALRDLEGDSESFTDSDEEAMRKGGADFPRVSERRARRLIVPRRKSDGRGDKGDTNGFGPTSGLGRHSEAETLTTREECLAEAARLLGGGAGAEDDVDLAAVHAILAAITSARDARSSSSSPARAALQPFSFSPTRDSSAAFGMTSSEGAQLSFQARLSRHAAANGASAYNHRRPHAEDPPFNPPPGHPSHRPNQFAMPPAAVARPLPAWVTAHGDDVRVFSADDYDEDHLGRDFINVTNSGKGGEEPATAPVVRLAPTVLLRSLYRRKLLAYYTLVEAGVSPTTDVAQPQRRTLRDVDACMRFFLAEAARDEALSAAAAGVRHAYARQYTLLGGGGGGDAPYPRGTARVFGGGGKSATKREPSPSPRKVTEKKKVPIDSDFDSWDDDDDDKPQRGGSSKPKGGGNRSASLSSSYSFSSLEDFVFGNVAADDSAHWPTAAVINTTGTNAASDDDGGGAWGYDPLRKGGQLHSYLSPTRHLSLHASTAVASGSPSRSIGGYQQQQQQALALAPAADAAEAEERAFVRDAVALAAMWRSVQTAHCFFVPPVDTSQAALGYERRRLVARALSAAPAYGYGADVSGAAAAVDSNGSIRLGGGIIADVSGIPFSSPDRSGAAAPLQNRTPATNNGGFFDASLVGSPLREAFDPSLSLEARRLDEAWRRGAVFADFPEIESRSRALIRTRDRMMENRLRRAQQQQQQQQQKQKPQQQSGGGSDVKTSGNVRDNSSPIKTARPSAAGGGGSPGRDQPWERNPYTNDAYGAAIDLSNTDALTTEALVAEAYYQKKYAGDFGGAPLSLPSGAAAEETATVPTPESEAAGDKKKKSKKKTNDAAGDAASLRRTTTVSMAIGGVSHEQYKSLPSAARSVLRERLVADLSKIMLGGGESAGSAATDSKSKGVNADADTTDRKEKEKKDKKDKSDDKPSSSSTKEAVVAEKDKPSKKDKRSKKGGSDEGDSAPPTTVQSNPDEQQSSSSHKEKSKSKDKGKDAKEKAAAGVVASFEEFATGDNGDAAALALSFSAPAGTFAAFSYKGAEYSAGSGLMGAHVASLVPIDGTVSEVARHIPSSGLLVTVVLTPTGVAGVGASGAAVDDAADREKTRERRQRYERRMAEQYVPRLLSALDAHAAAATAIGGGVGETAAEAKLREKEERRRRRKEEKARAEGGGGGDHTNDNASFASASAEPPSMRGVPLPLAEALCHEHGLLLQTSGAGLHHAAVRLLDATVATRASRAED